MKVAPIPAAQNPARSPSSDAARRRSAVATVGVGTTAGPFLALPGGASPRLRRGSLERAYDDFVSTGAMDPSLRPVVADSWRLSRASGVSPHSVLPTVDLLDADLETYRSAHPLAAVMPLIRQLLTDEAEGSNAIVVVADADARLLWVEGDRALRRHAEAMNWVAGSRWDEASTGTNAPAAAMRLNHALQVFAREHYASNVAAWSCTAAPIHDPISGRVLGALDITGRDDVAAPVVLGLVRAAVAAVESELRINAFARRMHRSARHLGSTAGPAVGTGVLALSVLGRDRAVLRRAGGGAPLELSVRHSELLFLLFQRPAGYTADQLAIALHERDVPAVTVRAELSRLRSLIPGLALQQRPYRITQGVQSDVQAVRARLAAGDTSGAAAAYPGPILPSSQSPEVQVERDHLHRQVRSAVLGSSDAATVLQFANAPSGRDDVLAWRRAADLADAATRPVVIEQLARIERATGI